MLGSWLEFMSYNSLQVFIQEQKLEEKCSGTDGVLKKKTENSYENQM
jgi:hypothetical protein